MKAVLRVYRRDTITVNSVTLEVLRLEREQEVEVPSPSSQEAERLYEVLATEVERYRRDSKGYLVELRVKHPELGEELAFGEQTARRKAKTVAPLFPEPARLKRVAVIKEGEEHTNLSKLRWTPVDEGVYVFEGTVTAEDSNVRALVLDTDKGIKVVVLR